VIRTAIPSKMLPLLLAASIAALGNLAARLEVSNDNGASPHLVAFLSGDIVAQPQTLDGTVAEGKADLRGMLKAAYNFDKWITKANQGDPSVYEILRKAQIAAGGFLTGNAQIMVDASAVVNSYIEVVIEVGKDQYTIKLYTCVDHRKTVVTETATSLEVLQKEGTACAYKYPQCAWSNEGEDLVYRIQK
jgi:hypothetical protein